MLTLPSVQSIIDERLSRLYYPDFSEYRPARNHYYKPFTFQEVLTIGWLQSGHVYAQGKVDHEIINKLKDLLALSGVNVNRTRGIHRCDLCVPSDSNLERIVVRHNEQEILLGHSELWIPANETMTYVAPTLIYHYIIEHQYKPPDVFLNAVKQFDTNAQWNGQEVYLSLVNKYRKEKDTET